MIKGIKLTELKKRDLHYYSLPIFASSYSLDCKTIPFCLRIIAENLIRNIASKKAPESMLQNFVDFLHKKREKVDIEFYPHRVLLQDFTGVPVLVDISSMRTWMQNKGYNPENVNPIIPVDLVVDHSLQVHSYAQKNAAEDNKRIEFEQNSERYNFLDWARSNFSNLRVMPFGAGICHQVNMECIASITVIDQKNKLLYPETLIGTDSHTTMINSLSVLGWGVGGIEAEEVMLGEGISLPVPKVVGCKLIGKLSGGITGTDLALRVTHELRKHNVVDKFVEFFGAGIKELATETRAAISNMAPEYGATCGFFPFDEKTLEYMKITGRSEEHCSIIEEFFKAQMLWNLYDSEPFYDEIIEIDLNSVQQMIAGPKRPQDIINIENASSEFHGNTDFTSLHNGAVAIAAITSCTNTSNPDVLIAAGLVAKKALSYGLNVKPYVKTSFAPGSLAVTSYMQSSGLQDSLDKIGFNVVGYGCTTCIGNSGPLKKEFATEIENKSLTVCAVLSGNRNFEGRIHPLVKNNYLASPPLVVLYALAGSVAINMDKDPIGISSTGKEIFKSDLWPTDEEIAEVRKKFVTKDIFEKNLEFILNQNPKNTASKTDIKSDGCYPWNQNSSYIKNPPYFDNVTSKVESLHFEISKARILALLGDSITTDHISPAGDIPEKSPAGRYLHNMGILKDDFNSYGSRRGNHEVMARGTLANSRLTNEIVSVKGGFTIHFPSGIETSIFEASEKYKKDGISLVIVAGKEYGSGSSRDWASKGVALLGVKAVIAESFERIHRSNLIGMGVVPILFEKGVTRKTLGFDGSEIVSIYPKDPSFQNNLDVECHFESEKNGKKTIHCKADLRTAVEIERIQHGGSLCRFIRKIAERSS